MVKRKRPSSPTSVPTTRRFPPGPGSLWQTAGKRYAPDPVAVGTTVSQAVDSQPRSPVRAPRTTDTHPSTTTRTADARSVVRAVGRQACGGRVASASCSPTPSLAGQGRTSELRQSARAECRWFRLPYVPPRLQWELTPRYSPLTTWVRKSGQASAGISLHFPSARRSAARDGPERAGTSGDGGSCCRTVCARHKRLPGPYKDGTGPAGSRRCDL
jgi:hypothetical protein